MHAMALRWILLPLVIVSTQVLAARKVDLDYTVRLLPASGEAEVRLTLAHGDAVRALDLDLGRDGRYSGFHADGDWQPAADQRRGIWHPAAGKASLSYRVRLGRKLATGGYDSRLTDGWALWRGDDLVPPARLNQVDGTHLVARLQFELPQGWTQVETAWPRIGKQRFRIDDPSRLFDRPTGWMLAGRNLGSRRERIVDTDFTLTAPPGQRQRRTDTLTLLQYTWPQLQMVFPRTPGKVLLVGAAEPMQRHSLMLGSSVYLPTGRGLIDADGISPMLVELVQVLARITADGDDQWIVQGMARYYALEALHRSGGIGQVRYARLRQRMVAQGASVSDLRSAAPTPEQVARAVVVLQDLDAEIRKRSNGRRSLDDLARALMRLGRVDAATFRQLAENVVGGPSPTLDALPLKTPG